VWGPGGRRRRPPSGCIRFGDGLVETVVASALVDVRNDLVVDLSLAVSFVLVLLVDGSVSPVTFSNRSP